MNLLSREIVRHVLGSFGMVPPPNFGRVGISSTEFKLKDSLDLEFESNDNQMEIRKFGLWCGIAEQGLNKIRVLATDICDNENNYHEFSAVYRLDNSPIHAVKHLFDDNSSALFLVQLESENGFIWKPVGMEQKLIACAGFERINNFGITWQACDESEDLLPALLEVVEM